MDGNIPNINLMITNMLESVLEGSDKISGNIRFSEEAKVLISDLAEKARKTDTYKENEEKGRQFLGAMSPENMFNHMTAKILEAPTEIHMIMSVILMIPFIDEAIKKEVDVFDGINVKS